MKSERVNYYYNLYNAAKFRLRLVTVLLTKTLISPQNDHNQAVPQTLHASVFQKRATSIRPYNMYND